MGWDVDLECIVFRLFNRSIGPGVVAGRPPDLLQSSAGAKGRFGHSHRLVWPATQGEKTDRKRRP